MTNDEWNAVPETLKLIFEIQFKCVFAKYDKEIKEFVLLSEEEIDKNMEEADTYFEDMGEYEGSTWDFFKLQRFRKYSPNFVPATPRQPSVLVEENEPEDEPEDGPEVGVAEGENWQEIVYDRFAEENFNE